MEKTNKWKYVGVFLTPESKTKLQEMFQTEIPEGWKVYCHHMTLAFNNGSNEAQKMADMYSSKFGEEVELTIVQLGKSDRAMAVKVATDLPMINKLPHITVAVATGAKPVESNYIENWKNIPFPIKVKGVFNQFI